MASRTARALPGLTDAHHNYAFPRTPTSYRAGAAGTVTVAPVSAGTIKVARVRNAPGYRAFVDSGQASVR